MSRLSLVPLRPPAPKLAEELKAAPREGLASVALRNALAGWTVRLLAIAVSLVLTPFILGKLGKNLYGLVATTSSLFGYLWMLRGGLGSAMRRYVTFSHHAGQRELAQKQYASGFWLAFLLRLLVLAAGLLLAGPICRFLRLPDSLVRDGTIGVSLIVIAAVLGDVGTILEVPIYVTGKTYVISQGRAAGQLFRMGLVFLLLSLLAPSLTTYGTALIGAEIFAVLFMLWLASRSHAIDAVLPRPQLGDRDVRRSLLRFGGLALVSQAASFLYLSTDNLLIGRIYGAGSVTNYNLGTRWAPLVSGFLVAAVDSITPLLTQLEARAEEGRSRSAVVRAIAITTALAVPMCLVPCVIGDLFLVRWVGPEYRSSYPYMIAMLAPLIFDIAFAPVWTVLVARGRIGWIAAADAALALGNVAISLLLALAFGLGLLGFALGNTIALLAKNLFLRPIVIRREPGLPPMRTVFRHLALALLGSVPGLLVLWLARPWIGGSLAAVLVAGLLAGTVCVAGSMFASVGARDLRVLLRTLRGVASMRRGGEAAR